MTYCSGAVRQCPPRPPALAALLTRASLRSSFDVTWGASRLACQVDVTEEMVSSCQPHVPAVADANGTAYGN